MVVEQFYKSILQQCCVFTDITTTETIFLAEIMHPMIAVKNEQIFAQDDEGDTLFIIVRGSVNVLIRKRNMHTYLQNDKVKFMKITLKKIELAL